MYIIFYLYIKFVRFQNFRNTRENKAEIRFQYNYNYDKKEDIAFTGVGYILLEELLNGFKKTEV